MYNNPIDINLVLMMDTTGSMAGNIASAKKDAWRVIDEFSKDRDVQTLRVGFIAYRDHKDEYVTKTLSPTHDFTRVEQFIAHLSSCGGGDAPEAIAVAMRDATILFVDSHHEQGKILVWYCDAPPHGKKYNCGLPDQHPHGDPSGIDFGTEIDKLKEMNVLIYAVPFGLMASNRCLKENLNRWTNNQVYTSLRRRDSLAFTGHILHSAVLECILRREVCWCISSGMTPYETETHILGLGMSKRDIVIEGGGTKIRTEERRVTQDDIKKTTVAVESTRWYTTRGVPHGEPVPIPTSLPLNITIECLYPSRTVLGSFSLRSGETLSIGRHHFPAFTPGLDMISRSHFTLTPKGEGAVVVTDTSTNGSSVDGVRLQKNVPQTFWLPLTITLANTFTVCIK